MRELNQTELLQVEGGFKFHFNVFQSVFIVVAATLGGGPVGFGYAVGTLIAAQGAGQLHDMAKDEFGWKGIQ
jgi:hypothetical protein